MIRINHLSPGSQAHIHVIPSVVDGRSVSYLDIVSTSGLFVLGHLYIPGIGTDVCRVLR